MKSSYNESLKVSLNIRSYISSYEALVLNQNIELDLKPQKLWIDNPLMTTQEFTQIMVQYKKAFYSSNLQSQPIDLNDFKLKKGLKN